jgi:hypothetical protein
LHKRNPKEETDGNHLHDIVHHVTFKSDRSVVYGLFNALTTRQGSREKGETAHPVGSPEEIFWVFGLNRTVYE